MEDPVSLRPDRGAAAEHQHVQTDHVFFRLPQQDRGRQHAGTVRIQSARLVDAVAVIPHDAHGTAGELPEAL